jgi:hypothetical protein
MGAISIAFDTILAGALALPWLLLVVHLFFPDGEKHVASLPQWLKDLNQPAAVAVVLFAITYLIGSAVSRTAQDFFNDDDLHLSDGDVRLNLHRHLMFRVGNTEDRVLASTYCKQADLLVARPQDLTLAAEIKTFESYRGTCTSADPSSCLCWHVEQWFVRLEDAQEKQDKDLAKAASNLFGLQESGLLLRGEDATTRLRQLHDQVMVLRGAAFNSLITFALCLFAWGARLRARKPRPSWGWLIGAVPALLLLVATVAFFHHFGEHSAAEPPYMEFTLLLLGAAGGWLLWKPSPQAESATTDAEKKICKRWIAFLVASLLIATIAALAWWSSEVVYAQQVIYSYDSQPAPAASP